MTLLLPGEAAQAGTQVMPKTQVPWDAVFAVSSSGSRLIAYVDGAELAQFIAEKINEAEETASLPLRPKLTEPQRRLLIGIYEENPPDNNWVELLRADKVPAKTLVAHGYMEIRHFMKEARLTPAGKEEARRRTFKISAAKK